MLKIAQETYHIRRIFESCKTLEQVKNTNKLACFLVDKWSWYESQLGFSGSFDVDRLIMTAAGDMTHFYNEAKDRIFRINGGVIKIENWD